MIIFSEVMLFPYSSWCLHTSHSELSAYWNVSTILKVFSVRSILLSQHFHGDNQESDRYHEASAQTLNCIQFSDSI
jgi:hypothetical protein